MPKSSRRQCQVSRPVVKRTRAARCDVILAGFSFQVGDQFFDVLRGVRVRRHLPGELAVSQNLHFQFDALVFPPHLIIPIVLLLDDGPAFLFSW